MHELVARGVVAINIFIAKLLHTRQGWGEESGGRGGVAALWGGGIWRIFLDLELLILSKTITSLEL